MKTRRSQTRWLAGSIFLLAMWTNIAAGQPIIYYVDANATGANDGSSWPNAYIHLQDGISAAAAHDEIQVAAGVYRPDRSSAEPNGTGDREASFVLKNLVRIVGQFPPGGGDPGERDPNNKTILSGDLLGGDDPNTLVQNLLTDPTRADNSYHVIYSDLCGSPTLLDGLIITAGQADGADALGKGGGWYSISQSSPTVTNSLFTRNAAKERGGAWYNEAALCWPVLTGVTFSENDCANRGGGAAMLKSVANVELDACSFNGNYAASYGGGMDLDQSSPTILNSAFSGNNAPRAGAIWTDNCQAKFYDTVFSANKATTYGGACMLNGGQVSFNHCDFSDNQATSGGAIYSDRSLPHITGSMFFKNSATNLGGAVYNDGGHPEVSSSKFIANYSSSHGGAIVNSARFNDTNAYLTCRNCLFVANYVTDNGAHGGAVSSHYAYGDYVNTRRYTYATFTNCTFYANNALKFGGGIYTDSDKSTNTLMNCVLYENSDNAGGNQTESAQIYGGKNTVKYSCIAGLNVYIGNGNIGDDALFVNPAGKDWITGTPDDDLRLSVDDDSLSPCVDAGDNDPVIAAGLTTDIDGRNRRMDIPKAPDTGNGVAPIVDMGAYEVCPLRALPDESQLRQDWQQSGEPVCWCYPRQCHADADGKAQGKQKYWVSTEDLDILIAAWNKPLAEIKGQTLNTVPLICGDFDHQAQGKQKYRVSTNDLDILIANWNLAGKPDPNCP